jgi:hypothetical protein
MARPARGNENGELGSGIAARAGAFLQINYAGGSTDKRIARDLGISPSMAKMLRNGRGWTVARFDQVLRLWPPFRDFVFPATDQLTNRLEQLGIGFERLIDEFAELRRELRTDRAELRADVAALRQEVRNFRA